MDQTQPKLKWKRKSLFYRLIVPTLIYSLSFLDSYPQLFHHLLFYSKFLSVLFYLIRPSIYTTWFNHCTLQKKDNKENTDIKKMNQLKNGIFWGWYSNSTIHKTMLIIRKMVFYISIRLEPNIFLYYLKGSNIVYAYERC